MLLSNQFFMDLSRYIHTERWSLGGLVKEIVHGAKLNQLQLVSNLLHK